MILGAVVGIFCQQIISQIVVQELLRCRPRLGDLIACLIGVLAHFFARSTFTFSVALFMSAPPIARGFQPVILWALRKLRPARYGVSAYIRPLVGTGVQRPRGGSLDDVRER
jgi:hypothetical protein